MISVNRSLSCGATRCHITLVSEKPCSSSSGGPLPPTRAKMRPEAVLIHSEAKPGKRSARSGMVYSLKHHSQMRAASNVVRRGRCFKTLKPLHFVRAGCQTDLHGWPASDRSPDHPAVTQVLRHAAYPTRRRRAEACCRDLHKGNGPRKPSSKPRRWARL